MNRLLCCSLLLLGVALFSAPAQAQVYYSTYYAPAYAPATVYYPNHVTSYYAPAAVPVTSYMAPAVGPFPVTNYYAPTPVTSYYAPTPVTSYYAPAPVAIAPVYAAPVVVRARYTPFRTTYRVYGY